jgi:predicted acylesterase/phospholipase RssA
MTQETKWTLGPLRVVQTSVARQFNIKRPEDSRIPPGTEWEDYYVEFSGYFGSYGPHMFAAAPEMAEALREIARRTDDFEHGDDLLRLQIRGVNGLARAALQKAGG